MKPAARIFLFSLFLLTCVAANSQVNRPLRTAEGKTPKLPYTHMALTAKFVGTALGDPAWYYWCISL